MTIETQTTQETLYGVKQYEILATVYVDEALANAIGDPLGLLVLGYVVFG
jgi:hypothetical protein